MKRHRLCNRDTRGFSLLEIIVTLTVASVLGAILVQFMGTNLTGSVQPLIRVQDAFRLSQVMETMVADYNQLMTTAAAPLDTFKDRVETNSPGYGTYTLLESAYVTFDAGGNEVSGGDKMLKVTIGRGELRFTALFTE